MPEQQLINVAILSIERDLSANNSLPRAMDEVVQKFAGKDENRRIKLSQTLYWQNLYSPIIYAYTTLYVVGINF